MFYVCKCQLLIGKFSSSWLSTSPGLEGTVPPLSSLQAPQRRSWGARQPCIFQQEKVEQGDGSWGGKGSWIWVCKGFNHLKSLWTCRVLPENWGLKRRKGLGIFHVLASINGATRHACTSPLLSFQSEAKLFILAMTPLHKSSHTLWSCFAWFPSLHHAKMTLFKLASIPKSRCLECTAGQTPKTALNKLCWSLTET